MRIRPFEAGQEGALLEVFRASVRGLASADYTPAQIEAWCPAQEDVELRRQRLERIRSNRPWVVEIDGVIAAYADLQPTGYIDHFFVAADFAGRGIGRALMRQLHDDAHMRGIPTLSAHVSLTAQRFFSRAGFELVCVQWPVVRGVELENAVMRKLLGSG